MQAKAIRRVPLNLTVSFLTLFFFALVSEGLLRAHHNWLMAKEKSNLIRLTKDKGASKETFNIYYFGESTAKGFPYQTGLSLPGLVDYMLDYKVKGKKVISVDLSCPGEDAEYHLSKIKFIIKKRSIFYPSLFVVYSGHNEFMKDHEAYGFTRLSRAAPARKSLLRRSFLFNRIVRAFGGYKLEAEERKFFDVPLYDEPSGYRRTIEAYQETLAKAVRLSRENEIPLLISTLAINYAGWEPNRSLFCGNSQDKDSFAALMVKGRTAEEGKNFMEAVEYYKKALQLCGTFAETHYRLGKCYEKTGDYALAWEGFCKAVEFDGMPIRATQGQNNFIRGLGSEGLVFMADAEGFLRSKADNGIIGFNYMADAHHPNLPGYILISSLFSKEIRRIFHDPAEIRQLSQEELARVFRINFFDANIWLGRWFARLSTFRYDSGERLRLAEDAFSSAGKLDPSGYESYLGLAIVNFLRRNNSQAEFYLSKAGERNPSAVEEYLRNVWIRQIIKRSNKN
jgi:tetratricopeptide (TPR) repeat protein